MAQSDAAKDGFKRFLGSPKGSRWWSAVAAGALLPLLVFLIGHFAPTTYDAVMLPALYRVVLPNMWILFLTAGAVVMFRAEKSTLLRWLALFLLGGVVGLMVVNDWWYYSPWLLALLTPFVIWRFRWLLWSQSCEAVVAVLAIVVVVGAGAIFDRNGLLPEWDSRFSFGLSRVPNFFLSFGVLALLGAALVRWAQWHWFNGDEQNRALLTEILERKPRCAEYFNAVARLTPFKMTGASGRSLRFHPCAELANDWPNKLALFPLSNLPPRFLRPPWSFCYAAASQPFVAKPARFFRTPATKIGLPSEVLNELLDEAVQRGHQSWLTGLLGFDTISQPQNQGLLDHLIQRPAARQVVEFIESDHRFVRYLLLREAQIEARHYFFCEAPHFDGREFTSMLAEFDPTKPGRLQPATAVQGIGDTPTAGKAQPDWPRVAMEYLSLWQENVDRVFIQRADQLTLPLLGSAGSVDFSQLTCNLLACRRICRTAPETIHQQAADLALALFVGAGDLPEQIAQVLENKYFARHRVQGAVPFRNLQSSADTQEAGLAAAAYGLWCGARGNWTGAAMPFTLALDIAKLRQQSGSAWFCGIHIQAADVLQRLRALRRPGNPSSRQALFGEHRQINKILLDYLELDQRPKEPLTYDGKCTGTIFACAFALHLTRLEEENGDGSCKSAPRR